MATKLKFLFRDPQSALLSKTAVFGGTLLFAARFGFRPVPLTLFLFVSGILYFRPLTNAFTMPSLLPFAVLIGCIVFLSPLLLRAAPIAVLVVIFSLLFYFIVGIKETLLVHRARWHAAGTFTLLYILFLAFFLTDHGTYPFLKLTSILIVAFLLLRGMSQFRSISGNAVKQGTFALAAATFTFIAAELLWVVGFLPLSALSAAALVTITIIILADIFTHLMRSDISAKVMIFNISALVFLAVFLLFTASWKP